MSEHIEQAPHVPPFVTFVTSAVPMVFDNSLSYYEALCALWKWLQDDVVNVINNNATVTEDYIDLTNEYIEKFNELKTYVDTYFDNLDVQEEINNKLDAMVEDGSLQTLINDYLNSIALFGFDTVSDMVSSDNLINGSYARTMGYYAKNDGGQSLYKIRTKTGADVADGGSLIEMDDDTLVAELISFKDINIKQFGAKGDGTTVNTTAIQNAIYYAYEHGLNVYIPSGTFVVDKPLVLLSSSNELETSFTISGDGMEDTKLLFKDVTAISDITNVDGTYGFILLNETWLNSSKEIISGSGSTGRISITDMTLTCNDHSCDVGIYMPISTFSCSFKRMRIRGFDNSGVESNNNYYLSVCEQIRVDGSARSFYTHGGTHTSLKFDSCYSTSASTSAYEISGIYHEMNNCCADGCTGTVFNLAGYSGTVVSPGSESDRATCTFKGGQYTNVTIVGAYTFGNYTDSDIFHVDTGFGSTMIFVGGYIGLDNTATNRVMPGGLIKTDYMANVKFIGTRYGKYTTNNTHSQSGTNIEHSISNGSLLTRYGNKVAYIGFDGKTGNDNNKAGYVDGEAATPEILGNAIFFGLGEDAGHTADGTEIRWNTANNKGDILLSRNIREIGGLGWVQTNANSSSWGLTVNANTSDYLKIPVVLAGETADRPTKSLLTGQMYFDTTLNKPIFYKHGSSTGWVDATGTSV